MTKSAIFPSQIPNLSNFVCQSSIVNVDSSYVQARYHLIYILFHHWPMLDMCGKSDPRGGGGVLQISSDRDDQKKLFLVGLKFLIGLSDIK